MVTAAAQQVQSSWRMCGTLSCTATFAGLEMTALGAASNHADHAGSTWVMRGLNDFPTCWGKEEHRPYGPQLHLASAWDWHFTPPEHLGSSSQRRHAHLSSFQAMQAVKELDRPTPGEPHLGSSWA